MAFAYKLERTFGIGPNQINKLIGSLIVVRPYGGLHGATSHTTEPPIFGRLDGAGLHEYASNIRTYTEAISEPIADQITQVVGEAKTVVFLGFGFHRQNVALLKTTTGSKRMYFSHYKGSEENATYIDALLRGTVAATVTTSSNRKTRHHNGSCLDTLRTFQLSIFRGNV